MKRRYVHLFAFFALLIALNGCTIEKRLYNKGWNVSANRSWKQVRSERTTETPVAAENTSVVAERPAIGAELSLQPQDSVPVKAQLPPVVRSVRTDALPAESDPVIERLPETVDDTIYVDEEAYRKYRAAERRWSSSTKTVVAIVFGVLTIAAFVAFFLFITTGGTGMTVIGFIMTLLGLLLLAILLFLTCIVLLIIPSREKMMRKLEEKRLADEAYEKELEALPPEERDEVLRQDAEIAAKRRTTRLVVVFVALGLFLTAVVLPYVL